MKRSEIKKEYTWDIEKMYPTFQDWEDEASSMDKDLYELESFKGKLGESVENFKGFFTVYEKVARKIEKLYSYAHQKYDEDTKVSKSQELNSKAQLLYSKFLEKTSFVTPELLEMGADKYKEYKEKEPSLSLMDKYMDDIFRRSAHTLSKRDEEIIASFSLVMSSSSNTYSLLDNSDLKWESFDLDGEEKTLTGTNFVDYQRTLSSKEKRKEVYEKFYSAYRQFENTFASTLEGEIKGHVTLARLKDFSSPRAAALFENNVPEEVYDNLLEVTANHVNTLHEYIALKKEVLKLDTQNFSDIYLPLIKTESTKKFTYEEAVETVLEAIKPLGEDYVAVAKKGLKEDRWVDVEANESKRGGAYSGGCYDSYPYILLNFQGSLDDVFTLIHELGHSMHSYLTRTNQEYIYGDYSIFLAEIASTTNELLLLNYLLDKAESKEEKLELLNHYMDSFKSTVYRQTQFAEFEHKIHELVWNGDALTAERLNTEYKKLNEKYYGDAIEVDDFIAVEWARIPHFYYNYYVFQYATGFSSAVALSEKILHGTQEDKENYLSFLKAGSSAYPIDVLKKAGVDMTNKDALEEAMKKMDSVFKEFKDLILEK